jgi:hypothetical protein
VNPTQDFSEEVRKYISAVLANEGICYAYGVLEPCQEYLNIFVEDKELVNKIKASWEKEKENLNNFEVNVNDPISAQVAKIACIEIYLNRKEELIKEELNKQ